MVFNRYHFQVLLRLALITVTLFAVIYFYQKDNYWVTFGNLVFLVILQVILFFRYLTRWQKEIGVIANAVQQGDYSFHFNTSDKRHPLFSLYNTLNHITRHVRNIQAQSEEQNQYFEYILQNSQVGLAIYDGSGKILVLNDEFRDLAGIASLENIKELQVDNETLYTHLMTMALNRPQLIVEKASAHIKLSARLSKIVVREKELYILSLINITPELEENELQTWQELMSILTHEIMNSIAPIHSLNGTMVKHLDRIEGNEEIVARAKSNLDVINRRSSALMDFVERYRKISTVPLPVLQSVSVSELLRNVNTLLQEDLKGITLRISCMNEHIYADRSQIEQVVINLLKNAIHALSEQRSPVIEITASEDAHSVFITISDNGKGIPAEILKKIFMPFFTTKSSGSGIGLTISKQIMHRHQGTISVESINESGTSFVLQFRKPS